MVPLRRNLTCGVHKDFKEYRTMFFFCFPDLNIFEILKRVIMEGSAAKINFLNKSTCLNLPATLHLWLTFY
jgi:hypothetical protein